MTDTATILRAFSYCPESGNFYKPSGAVVTALWYPEKTVATVGYRLQSKGFNLRADVAAVAINFGVEPDYKKTTVYHINGDSFDNRRENLACVIKEGLDPLAEFAVFVGRSEAMIERIKSTLERTMISFQDIKIYPTYIKMLTARRAAFSDFLQVKGGGVWL